MTFVCSIYNHDYTFGNSADADPACVTLIARTAVRAGSPRSAAAKVYVRCVGRRRARLLQDVLQAPPSLIQNETDWRAIAPGLMWSSGRLGDCYCFDNLIEAWYIVVTPATLPLPAKRLPPSSRQPLPRRLLRSLRCPSAN
jgi:hypothetical protein